MREKKLLIRSVNLTETEYRQLILLVVWHVPLEDFTLCISGIIHGARYRCTRCIEGSEIT